ncbi:myelin transcription factor 1-like [Lytechinus pictus]|uniref:myelin transcription factor 1-like n=1 Tax=Lytechinus pictus TaxID=7653 RepID=UPI0030BA1777
MATEDKQIQYSPQGTPRSAAESVRDEQFLEEVKQEDQEVQQEEQEVQQEKEDVRQEEQEVPQEESAEIRETTTSKLNSDEPSTTGNDVESQRTAEEAGEEGTNADAKERITLVLPSVAGLVLDPDKAEVGKDGLAESVILDDDKDSKEELHLPQIEVNHSGKPGEAGLPTWNGGSESSSLQPSQKPRREIIAENAHPKCFGNVGAAGLSRVFTSGSYCPELSIRAMAPKVQSNDRPVEYKPSLPNFKERSKHIDRCRTIPDMARRQKDSFKMPEIRSSKVSLFARDGERAKNLQFGPASSWNLDRSRTDMSKSRLRDKLQDQPKRPESESDELTPSESGEMGQKIHQWFKKDRKKDQKSNSHVRNSKRSNNIWDAGLQSRIHRGLASSMLKPNESIGNYLNDVTSSRFPQVETRQIVSTKS